MILVTGASGLLGSSVVAVALEQGREVAGLYHRHPLHLRGAKMLQVDLAAVSETKRILQELRPAVVIHCAAETNVDWCEGRPEEADRINVRATASLAEIASEIGAQLLYISTDSVFDGTRGHYTEADQPAPVNIYARTKLEGEQEVTARHPHAVIARVTMYGWNAQPKQSLAEWMLGQLVLGNVLPGFVDTIFCPILATDLAQVLLEMVDRNLAGLYHVVGSEAVSKYEFARRLALTFGFDPERVVPARMTESKLVAPRPPNTSLNTEKICAALGRPMPDVDSGFRRFAQQKADGYQQRLRSCLAEALP